jgi:hypothetical protein
MPIAYGKKGTVIPTIVTKKDKRRQKAVKI